MKTVIAARRIQKQKALVKSSLHIYKLTKHTGFVWVLINTCGKKQKLINIDVNVCGCLCVSRTSYTAVSLDLGIPLGSVVRSHHLQSAW